MLQTELRTRRTQQERLPHHERGPRIHGVHLQGGEFPSPSVVLRRSLPAQASSNALGKGQMVPRDAQKHCLECCAMTSVAPSRPGRPLLMYLIPGTVYVVPGTIPSSMYTRKYVLYTIITLTHNPVSRSRPSFDILPTPSFTRCLLADSFFPLFA